MALTESQQFFELTRRANEILVVFRRDGNVDSATSALGVALALRRMGKKIEIVSQDFIPQTNLRFLPSAQEIKPSILGLQKFTVMINTDRVPPFDVQTVRNDTHVGLELIPHQGVWTPDDVKIKTLPYRFDCIVAIDTPDLEALGSVYREHHDFFATQPIINIDHNPANEHYGQVNLVDVAASSTAEVVWHIFSAFDRATIDAEVATALMAGITSATDRFTASRVTARTLSVASELVAMGARRSEVVAHLYRTRGVGALRLWGRALARLQHDAARKLVWTVLTRQDFAHAGAREDELPGVVEELIFSSPDAQVVVLLYEQESGGICGLLHTRRPHDARALAAHFGAAGRTDYVRFCLTGVSLVEAEREVLDKVRDLLV